MALMTDFERFIARTEPGPGMGMADDGVPGITHLKMRSIPNVPTERLWRRRAVLVGWANGTVVPSDGNDSRRKMVDSGMHKLCIEHELRLRKEME